MREHRALRESRSDAAGELGRLHPQPVALEGELAAVARPVAMDEIRRQTGLVYPGES